MINVEGYKMFRGAMRITPKCEGVEPFEIAGNWLYKPQYNCWYSGGRSFVADICEVVEDETERKHGHWVRPVPGDGEPYCSSCKSNPLCYIMSDEYELSDHCPHCGAIMDEEV